MVSVTYANKSAPVKGCSGNGKRQGWVSEAEEQGRSDGAPWTSLQCTGLTLIMLLLGSHPKLLSLNAMVCGPYFLSHPDLLHSPPPLGLSTLAMCPSFCSSNMPSLCYPRAFAHPLPECHFLQSFPWLLPSHPSGLCSARPAPKVPFVTPSLFPDCHHQPPLTPPGLMLPLMHIQE